MSNLTGFIVMGVCGSGKSTLGKALAARTGGRFVEGDDYHPPENRRKMASGQPLNDDDRAGWLDALADVIASHVDEEVPLFVSCSALKESYRARLRKADPRVRFIYLKGTRDALLKRMETREDHFMPASLLDSQLATLEEPSQDEAIVIEIDLPLTQQVDDVSAAFAASDRSS